MDSIAKKVQVGKRMDLALFFTTVTPEHLFKQSSIPSDIFYILLPFTN